MINVYTATTLENFHTLGARGVVQTFPQHWNTNPEVIESILATIFSSATSSLEIIYYAENSLFIVNRYHHESCMSNSDQNLITALLGVMRSLPPLMP